MPNKTLALTVLLMVSCSSLGYAGKTVLQNLGTAPDYIEGEFAFEKDHKSMYTVPHKPQKAPTQSVKIYRGRPEEMPCEKILKRVLTGKDGRQRVADTTQWPYLFHSQLTMHFPNGEYGGSGILVGPHHLLTAAHNVYDPDKKEWATRIVAQLGLNDDMAPFGDLKAVKIYTFEDWIKKKDPNFDLALIILDRSMGIQTGWCGLLCLEDNDLLQEEIRITGYPGDKGFKQMWTMSHAIKKVEPERIFYDIDTYGGQSGSGIWINKWGNPYTIGIHTLGEGGMYEGNSGVRLSLGKFQQLISEWISKTRDIQQYIPNKPSALPMQSPPKYQASKIASSDPLKDNSFPAKTKNKQEPPVNTINNTPQSTGIGERIITQRDIDELRNMNYGLVSGGTFNTRGI